MQIKKRNFPSPKELTVKVEDKRQKLNKDRGVLKETICFFIFQLKSRKEKEREKKWLWWAGGVTLFWFSMS